MVSPHGARPLSARPGLLPAGRMGCVPLTPEQQARRLIDTALDEAGWLVQDRAATNLSAGRGVAIREFRLAEGHGVADYLLFVDGRPVGVLEAKPVGHSLAGVEWQAVGYATGLPAGLDAPVDPLPFVYLSTGVDTRFINLLDPDPKTRRLSAQPHIHQPATLAEWLGADTLDAWVKRRQDHGGLYTAADARRPSSLRARLRTLPELEAGAREFLYPNQVEAVGKLEHSLKNNRTRALVQMATGSGKTIFAITAVHRLIEYAGARRVLFLVDRRNLGEQAQGVPGLPHAGGRPPVRRAVRCPAPRLEHHRRGEQGRHHHRPAPLLDASGRTGVRHRPGGGVRLRVGRRGAARAAARGLQRRLPARVLRHHRHRRVPPLNLHAVAAGAGVLRRLPDRPHRHAVEAHFRLLRRQSGHGVRPRARRRRRRERRLRGLRHPHADHRPGVDHRSGAGDHGRVPQPPHPRAALGAARRGHRLRRRRARPRGGRPRPDPHPRAHVPRAPVHRDLPRPPRSPQNARLCQGRQPRRGHRGDRARRVRPRQCLLPEDHLPDDRRRPSRPDPGVPQQLRPAHRRHRGHDRHRRGHPPHRDRDVHAVGEEPRALRADEGPGRAGRRPRRTAGGHPGCRRQDPLRDRRLRRHDDGRAGRDAAARAQAHRAVGGAPRARGHGRNRPGRALVARQPGSRASPGAAARPNTPASPRRPADRGWRT